MHVMIDEPDDIMDYRIASHIVAVHQRQDQAFDVPYTMAEIQLYLKYARAHKPELTAAVSCSNLDSPIWPQKCLNVRNSRCVVCCLLHDIGRYCDISLRAGLSASCS